MIDVDDDIYVYTTTQIGREIPPVLVENRRNSLISSKFPDFVEIP